MMNFKWRASMFYSIACTAVLTSCAGTSQVKVSSNEPGSALTLVSMEDPSSKGQTLRNPALLDTSQLNNKLVRIEKPGKIPQYLLVLDGANAGYSVSFKSLYGTDKHEDRNGPVRLLLKAYQALTSNDYNLVKEYAKQAANLDPQLAGPNILTGLAYLREKNSKQAKLYFLKAKGLDPEDPEIGELIKLAQ